jgi:hypothetical protein
MIAVVQTPGTICDQLAVRAFIPSIIRTGSGIIRLSHVSKFSSQVHEKR